MHERIYSLLFPFINLTIFILLFYFLLKNPLLSFLKKRKETIITSVKESETIYHEAVKKVTIVRNKMAKIDQEGEAYVATLRADAAYFANRLIKEAEDKAILIAKETDTVIEAEEQRQLRLFKTSFISRIMERARIGLKQGLSDDETASFMKDIKR